MVTPGRQQLAGRGGCWFLAILNGFLLGFRGRELLKKRLQEYKNRNLAQFKRYLSAAGNVCPMPGRLNSGVFWSYVNERLRTKSRNINKTVNQNVLIRNLKLTNNNNLNRGTEFDLEMFLKNLWPAFKTPESPVLTLRYVPMFGHAVPALVRLLPGRPEFNSVLKKRGTGVYRLSHAYIAGSWRKANGKFEGHSICGYIRPGGVQMVYDSNQAHAFHYNWRTNWKLLQQHMYNQYARRHNFDPERIKITYVAVYIRTDEPNANNVNNVPMSWPPNSILPVENRWLKQLTALKDKHPSLIGKIPQLFSL